MRQQSRQFSLRHARHLLCSINVRREPRGLRLAIAQARRNCRSLSVERGHGLRGIVAKRLLTRGLVGLRCPQSVKLGQPPDDRVAPGPRGRQFMRQAPPPITRLSQGHAPRPKLDRRRFLLVLRLAHQRLQLAHRDARRVCFSSRRTRRSLRFVPPGEQQFCLRRADTIGERSIAFCRPRLPPQGRRAQFLVAQQFIEPGDVGLGRAELLLGILAPRVEPRNPRRFLEHLAALGRLGSDHRPDPPLADQSRRMRPRRGIGEQQRDVFLPHVAPVDPIGRPRAALDPAGDFAFAA